MDEAVNENFKRELPGARRPGRGSARRRALRTCPRPRRSRCRSRISPGRLRRTPEPRRRGYWVPRAAIFAGAAVLTAAFAYELFSILAFGQMTPLQFVFLVLSTIAFGWIALGSLSAALGFLPLFAGRGRRYHHAARDAGAARRRARRCCFPSIMRIPRASPARSRPWRASSRARAPAGSFDVFVLSDTRGDGGWRAARTRLIAALHASLAGVMPVYYRRRRDNTHRKAGNIADWVERFGAGYEHFVILDGDSVMSGETLVALAGAMEDDPEGRSHPDRAAPRRRPTLLQHLHAVRLQHVRSRRRRGYRLLASRPGQLLGPQRHHPHGRLCVRGGAAGAVGPQAVRRAHPEPRLRRGGAAAARRLGRAHDAEPSKAPTKASRPISSTSSSATGAGRRATCSIWPSSAQAGPDAHGPRASRHGRRVLSHLGGLGAVAHRRHRAGPAGRAVHPELLRRRKTLFPIWPIIDPGAALRLFLATLASCSCRRLLGLMLEWKRARMRPRRLHCSPQHGWRAL